MKEMFSGSRFAILIANLSYVPFNQPLNNWDVSSVTTMEGMFSFNNKFDQPLNNWNVSKVTTMHSMFRNALRFNSDVSSWDVSSVTTMASMFYSAVKFNQEVSQWDVSSVTTMASMFYSAGEFNQDISEWDVSNVREMKNIFSSAEAFNQDLSEWNIKSISPSNEISFSNSGMSCENYSRTLKGWSKNPNLSTEVVLNASGMKYSYEIIEERVALLEVFGWKINFDKMGSCSLSGILPFMTVWKTDNDGISNENEITIPAHGGFAYDIWGDTVNTAARMEQNSHPGKINISEATYELVKDDIKCECRGKVQVKNKGMMNMYFVDVSVTAENQEVITS